jgi:hypothetical protein
MPAKKNVRRAAKTIRLACNSCFRDDCDGITAKRLRFLRSKAGGWKNVSREQTARSALRSAMRIELVVGRRALGEG